MKRLLFGIALSLTGCVLSCQAPEDRASVTLDNLVRLAEAGNVEGSVSLAIEDQEAGLKNAAYYDGGSLHANLNFRFIPHATSQPTIPE